MAQVNVYTRSYGTSRTGANLQETILTPTNDDPRLLNIASSVAKDLALLERRAEAEGFQI
jgi:hypothetical protein